MENRWKFFRLGFLSSACTAGLPFIPYPFAFAERALTFDWDGVGGDVQSAMNQLDQSVESEE